MASEFAVSLPGARLECIDCGPKRGPISVHFFSQSQMHRQGPRCRECSKAYKAQHASRITYPRQPFNPGPQNAA
jgi:hypothetical protein